MTHREPGLREARRSATPMTLARGLVSAVVFFTILGLETRRMWVRTISWVSATGCLFVVGLTVSRAPLAAAAISTALAFRRVLKRGFFPFLCLIALAWIRRRIGGFRSVRCHVWLSEEWKRAGVFLSGP